MTNDLGSPETRYATSDGLSIAYQVFGSGTQDLVMIPPIVSHLDATWAIDLAYARVLRTLAQTFRVIVFDKRGQGLSDSFEGVPTLEERMDDVVDVMRAAGSDKAVIFARSEGGSMAALFTATYPERVHQLVLFGAMARFTHAPDYPHVPTLEHHLQAIEYSWGKEVSVRGFAPSHADDKDFCERFARYQRQTASPNSIKRLIMANDRIDVRAILSQIRRPTLVIQQRGDRIAPCANGRYLADHIPGAVYLELPGADHVLVDANADAVINAIGQFTVAGWAPDRTDRGGRWLATVLFTDIVGSTEHAVSLGDKAWRDLLQRFHAMGRTQLEAYRGKEVDTAGDGLFATFDGPARAIRCAAAMTREAKALGLALRAGLHTGEVEATGDKVSGMAVHIGARVMSQAGSGEVWVSNTVRDLVAGSGIRFEERGTHALKGVPGEWPLSLALAEKLSE
jgi:pimeloyl-ACP methyl ester carboxylesterase/class 3 adenylate cyclase